MPPNGGKGANCSGGTLDPHHLEGYIKMAWAKSLLGPWNTSRHTMVILAEGKTVILHGHWLSLAVIA